MLREDLVRIFPRLLSGLCLFCDQRVRQQYVKIHVWANFMTWLPFVDCPSRWLKKSKNFSGQPPISCGQSYGFSFPHYIQKDQKKPERSTPFLLIPMFKMKLWSTTTHPTTKVSSMLFPATSLRGMLEAGESHLMTAPYRNSSEAIDI